MPRSSSTTVAGSTSFQGVALHYPASAESTYHLYQYGTIQKGESLRMEGVPMKFVGRSSRVWDFGTQNEDEYKFSVYLPFGTDYADLMDRLRDMGTARDVVCVRDGRGRLVYGIVSAWDSADDRTGTVVSMTISSADFVEGA